MSNISIVRKEPERKVVAFLYYTHLVMRGKNGEAIFLSSKESESPKPNTAFVHSEETFQSLLEMKERSSELKPIYEGDLVEIQF